MADADTTQLDLQNLTPEQAAALARAQQQALARQQQHALVGLLSAMPQAQKAGELEYAQAGKEREGGQRTAANVLKLSLEKLSQERQLAALQQQIAYQNAQLKLMGAQFGEQVRQHGAENLRQDYEAYLRGLHTPPASLVEREGKTAGELDYIKKVTEEAKKHLGPLGGAAEAVGGVLGAGKQAELSAVEEEKKKGGYRVEAPLSFEEFARARMGGGPVHPGVSPAVPQAPGGAMAPATQGPAPTHYRYNKDRSMRIPTDASGKPLGPPEPNR